MPIGPSDPINYLYDKKTNLGKIHNSLRSDLFNDVGISNITGLAGKCQHLITSYQFLIRLYGRL